MLLRAGGGLTGSGTEPDAALLGWESPTYGQLCPAISLVYRTRARLPVRLVTSVLLGEELSSDVHGDNLVLRRGSECVREVSLLPQSATAWEKHR